MSVKKLISILARNRPGVLSHVAGLITRRGYNVESIAAGPTEHPDITRITLVVAGDEHILEQVVRQFRKLIDVISVEVPSYGHALTGELALISISADSVIREEILNLATLLGLKVMDIQEDSLTLMAVGTAHTVDTAVVRFSAYSIKALARTGVVALPKPIPESG